jgi:hypothetical protein
MGPKRTHPSPGKIEPTKRQRRWPLAGAGQAGARPPGTACARPRLVRPVPDSRALRAPCRGWSGQCPTAVSICCLRSFAQRVASGRRSHAVALHASLSCRRFHAVALHAFRARAHRCRALGALVGGPPSRRCASAGRRARRRATCRCCRACQRPVRNIRSRRRSSPSSVLAASPPPRPLIAPSSPPAPSSGSAWAPRSWCSASRYPCPSNARVAVPPLANNVGAPSPRTGPSVGWSVADRRGSDRAFALSGASTGEASSS